MQYASWSPDLTRSTVCPRSQLFDVFISKAGGIIFMSEARHKTKIFGLANNTIRRHATLSCSVCRAPCFIWSHLQSLINDRSAVSRCALSLVNGEGFLYKV